jgi:2-hydroxycyclohexanecarboxyl-CoA dehydrogenase
VNGKTVLVTGAAGAMGSAVVARLHDDGYTVAACDIDGDGLGRVSAACRGVATFTLDQTDETAVRAMVDAIEARVGPVYGLVNVTGWTAATRFDTESSAYWRKVVAINYEAALYVAHAVLAPMTARRQGRMVFVTSDAARIGTGGEAVYAGAKAAVVAFAKSLARENARHGILVNATCPGPTEGPLLDAAQAENPELIARIERMIPLRRLARPADQAGIIAFLLSDDAAYITGQAISVSGGLTML